MQFKSLVNPSFLVITLELQDAFLEGWRIDPDNLPVNNLMYSEIHLVKDEAANIKENFSLHSEPSDTITAQEIQAARKPAGRPPRVKQ